MAIVLTNVALVWPGGPTITSAVDGTHSEGSLHYVGEATYTFQITKEQYDSILLAYKLKEGK